MLAETKLKALKPKDKLYKVADLSLSLNLA